MSKRSASPKKFSSPRPVRRRPFPGRRAFLPSLLFASTLFGPLAARADLPWLTPAPATNAAPEPPPAPPPLPRENMTLQPGALPNPSAEDVTPGSDVPHPFRFLHPAGEPDQLAAHLLVVYNSGDPESKPLADYYARRRGIPSERVLAIACPAREEITRDEYDKTIRQPITGYLFGKNWLARRAEIARLRNGAITLLAATRNDIWAIVLMRGVPLKIAATADFRGGMQTEPGLATNAAAVDSELALLPVFGLPLGGFVPNPFFDAANSGELRIGPELATRLILVTRLDGPAPADVRRMIDDTLTAETHRLAGEAVIDTRGLTDAASPMLVGDVWLRKSRDLLAADGWSVAFDDRPETLPATDPVGQVALYLGWYAPNAVGPWVTPPGRFVPGAIAYHIHSFSANTLRSTTGNWAGPLLAHGAAATMGCVYEPYLILTPHLDVFTRRLLDGDSLAEAAYASQAALSWMVTVVGDPLYRPFQQPVEEAVAIPPGDHRDWLLLQQERMRLASGALAKPDAVEAALDLPGAGAVAHEGLGDLLQKMTDPSAVPGVEKAYRTALRLSVSPVDAIRIGLKLARCEVAHQENARARDDLRDLLNRYPADADRFGVTLDLPPAR